MAKYFRALGDPTRLRILELIADREDPWGSSSSLLVGRSRPSPITSRACAGVKFVLARREHRSIYYSIADPRVLELLRLAGGLLGNNAARVVPAGHG